MWLSHRSVFNSHYYISECSNYRFKEAWKQSEVIAEEQSVCSDDSRGEMKQSVTQCQEYFHSLSLSVCCVQVM